MAFINDANILTLMLVLEEVKPDKAREKFLRAAQIDALDDQTIHDDLEGLIYDAMISGQPTIEMDVDVAFAAFVILKRGVRRPRGGQRNSRSERLSKKALGKVARNLKGRYVKRGERATEAHLKAAAVVQRYGRLRGLEFSEETIAREMDNIS